MRALAASVVLAACVTLAGCDRFGSMKSQTNDSAAAAPANAVAAKPGAAPGQAASDPGTGLAGKTDGAVQAGSGTAGSGGSAVIDRAYMVGRWSDDDDCDRAADFFADGRFVPAAGQEGLWNLNGDRLTIVAGGATHSVQLVPIDRNAMTVVNADGSLGQSTRC